MAKTVPAVPDPLDINQRLYKQIGVLLDDLETGSIEITVPQRIGALIAIGRILVMFKGLRKENDAFGAGSAVRKYATAFAANAARRGAASPGAADDPDTGLDPDDFEEFGRA